MNYRYISNSWSLVQPSLSRIFVMKVESFVFFYIVFFVCMFCVNIIIIKNLKTYQPFECSDQNSSNSSCQSWNNKSVPHQVSHHFSVSRKIAPQYFFSSNIINFTQKEPAIKVQFFEIFKCLGQILQIPQFWNNKLIPLQFFNHSSVSLVITPL